MMRSVFQSFFAVVFWLALSSANSVYADSKLGSWRSEIALTRIQAENDAPAAYKQALHLQETLPPDAAPADRARLLNLLSRIETYYGKIDQAAAHAKEAFDLARQHGDRVGQLEADLNTALFAVNQGRISDMATAVTHAMTLLDGVARPELQVEAMLRAAMLYRRFERIDESVALAVRTLEVAKRSGNDLALAYAYQGMAGSYEHSFRYGESSKYFALMRDAARRAHSRLLEAEALLSTGIAYTHMDRGAEGEPMILQAIKMYRTLGMPFYLGRGLYMMADGLQLQGNQAEAVVILNEVVELYASRNHKIGLWWALDARGRNYLALGKLDLAQADAERGYRLAKGIDFPIYVAGSAKRLSTIYRARGDYKRAYDLSAEATAITEQVARDKSGQQMLDLAKSYEAKNRQQNLDELSRRNQQQAVQLHQRELERRWLGTLAGSSLILLTITAIFLLRQRRSHRQLEAAHQALRDREREFRTLAENSPDVIARYDLDGRRLYANSTMQELFETSADNLIGHTPADQTVTSLDIMGMLRQVFESGQPLRAEGPFKNPNRTEPGWGDIRLVPEFSLDGQMVSVLLIGRDFTDQRSAEMALRESELQFRTLTEHTPDVVARYDRDCRYLYCNPQLVVAIGLPLAEIVGKRPTELRNDTYIQQYQEEIQAVLVTGKAREMMHILPPLRGNRRIHDHVRFVPEFDAEGQIVSVLAIGRDVSAIKDTERQLSTLVENLPDFIVRLDTEGRHLYVNPTVTKAFGKTSADFIGKTVPEIDLTGDAQQDQQLLDEVLKCVRVASPVKCEMTFPSPSGNRHVELTHLPERDEFGHVVTVLAVGRDITERYRMEQELIRREHEFRTLAESAPDNIGRYDRDARLVYINPELERTMGAPLDAVVGKLTSEIFPDNPVIVEYETMIRTVVETGKPLEYEMITGAAGTRPIFDMIRIAPEFDEQGNVTGAIAIGRDYTEQKRLEQALQRREQEFRALAENTPDSIVRYDRDCRRIYFNRSYAANKGVDPAMAKGKAPMEYWVPALNLTAEEYTERLQHVMATGKPDELLLEIRGEDDALSTHFSMSLVPEFDADGWVMSVLSVSHDVTGIKRMESMLRKSEQEFRTLAENSPNMIVRYDHGCRRVFVNPAYEHYTEIPLEQAWNKLPEDVWKPDMPREEYRARLEHVMATGQSDSILLEWKRSDGKLTSHQMLAVAEYDEQGEVTGVLVIGSDITEFKATERRLEESSAKLRAMTAQREVAREEERKRIAREIHDELGQLLNVLRLNVTTLDYRFGEENAELRAKAGNMVGTVDRAIAMVRSLATRLRPAVLNAGIGPALDWMVQEFTESTGIKCVLHLPEHEIVLDEGRSLVIFRIVQESITNVLRHSGATRVDITVHEENDVIEVDVQDNGSGFKVGKSGRRDSFGIVGMRERALMLGGKLDVISSPGEGTLLRVSVPVVDRREWEE